MSQFNSNEDRLERILGRTAVEDLIFDSPALKQEHFNTVKYGAPPGSRLPNWVKEGYNQSLQGAAQAVMRGEKVFKVD